MNVKTEIDTSGFEAGFDGALAKLEQRAVAGAYQIAERIMARSKQEFVPVDKGILRASGYVELPSVDGNQITVRLGFGGPAAAYAAKVHENPRSGKTGGVSPSGHKYKHYAQVGQWKYLEQPLKEAQAGLGEAMKKAVFG